MDCEWETELFSVQNAEYIGTLDAGIQPLKKRQCGELMEQVIRYWLQHWIWGKWKQRLSDEKSVNPQTYDCKLVVPKVDVSLPRLTPWSFVSNYWAFRINHTYTELVFMWTSLVKDWWSTFLVVTMNFGCSVQSWATITLQLLLKEHVKLMRSNVLKSPSLTSHVAAKQNQKRNGGCNNGMVCCCRALKTTSVRLDYTANRKRTSTSPWQNLLMLPVSKNRISLPNC